MTAYRATRGPREDDVCGAWIPVSRAFPVHSQARRVCARRHHPGSEPHITADSRWLWRTGDDAATTHPETDTVDVNTQERANPDTTKDIPMTTPTITIAFDKPTYRPGDTIRMSILVEAPGDTRTIDVTGSITLDADDGTHPFTATYTVVDYPDVIGWHIDSATNQGPGGWTRVSADTHTAVFETTA